MVGHVLIKLLTPTHVEMAPDRLATVRQCLTFVKISIFSVCSTAYIMTFDFHVKILQSNKGLRCVVTVQGDIFS